MASVFSSVNLRVFSCASLVAISCSLPVHAKPPSPFGTRDQPVFAAKEISDLVITLVPIEKLATKTLRFGHVGEPGQPKREELLAAFNAFQTQYTVSTDGKIVEAAPWKDNGLAEISVTLRQEPAAGFYMLGVDAAHCILLKAPDESTWAVGQKIRLLAYTTGVQEWTDTAGTVQKAPLYEALVLPLPSALPDAPTRKQLITALRAGQSFDVIMPPTGSTAENSRPVVQKLVW